MNKYFILLAVLSGCTLSVITTAPMPGARQVIDSDQAPDNEVNTDLKVPVGT